MDFIHRDTITIARDLLGVRIIFHDEQQILTGYIVETEAYVGTKDQAGPWI
ncbi:3-methylpurine glycosylase [Staphylococcus gallinarum]|uniref:3-methylpurine glycosylase n=1 Tax=Staphylococcus gallinarum TaxID=1293 RepID=A0A380FMD4_STAGA|nr:3-methylpurine glycosylase [Staphylococcus gallinarum]